MTTIYIQPYDEVMKAFSRTPDLTVLTQVYLSTGLVALIVYSLWGDSSSKTWRFVETLAWFSFLAFAANLVILYLLKGNAALNKNPDKELAELKKAIFVADSLFDIAEQLNSTKANKIIFKNDTIGAPEKELVLDLARRRSASKAEDTKLAYAGDTDKVSYGKALLNIKPFSEEAETLRHFANDGYQECGSLINSR